VNEIFDEISYCKGAACIMMIVSYLGMEMFRKGICAYLEKHKYGNARTDDLWAALSEGVCVSYTYIYTYIHIYIYICMCVCVCVCARARACACMYMYSYIHIYIYIYIYIYIASGKDVKAFMNVWTKEVGYPVVSLSRGDDGKLNMEQARFLSNGKALAQVITVKRDLVYMRKRDPSIHAHEAPI